MATSESDFYHDDPVDFDSSSGNKKKISSVLAFLLLAVGGTFFVQSTLAANFNLNTGSPLEFGQGTLQTVACSGESQLTITPYSLFVNAAGGGGSYLDTITVSGIPDGCAGSDFTIKAYGDSDNTPLALFNTDSNTVIVQTFDTPGTTNDSATAWGGLPGISVSASSSGDAFTVSFTTPVALSSTVSKLTIETSKPYSVGGVGSAGGNIFYVSATGFNCGPLFTARCKYLEAAPKTWAAGVLDVKKQWATGTDSSGNAVADVSTIPNEDSANNSSAGFGLGYKNSIAIVNQGNGATTGAGAARAYVGGSKSDWYLPTVVELNQMCKWARGIAWTSDQTVCTGGTINTGIGASGFLEGYYWSASEVAAGFATVQQFGPDVLRQGNTSKSNSNYVRPVRAF
jgi:hypothetical protein